MPAEMLQTSSSLPQPQPASSASTSSAAAYREGGSSKSAQRKDRSCKGKRYLEMISESKGTKRVKSNSISAGSGGDAESPNKTPATGSAPSKWVSGTFDLEERIAALPQLDDGNLMNALSHTKTAGKAAAAATGILLTNGTSSSSSSTANKPSAGGGERGHRDDAVPGSPTKVGGTGDKMGVSTVNSKLGGASNDSSDEENGKLKLKDGDSKSAPAAGAGDSAIPVSLPNGKESAGINANANGGLAVVPPQPTSPPQVSTPPPSALAAGDFLRAQGVDMGGPCDGLAALAEVALSQAHCQATAAAAAALSTNTSSNTSAAASS